jgi:AmmeMemoRadiSam system protein A
MSENIFLTDEEKKLLLDSARDKIERLFDGKEEKKIDYDKFDNLKKNYGAFVTLRRNGELRGCIGFIKSQNNLFETVKLASTYAATIDKRFEPISKEELPFLDIEISVLSAPQKIRSYDEIVLGKHGLIVREPEGEGLLLPQVLIEHKMNKEEYLSSICRKAGLRPNLWKEKMLNLYVFTAEVFSESEFKEDAKNEND